MFLASKSSGCLLFPYQTAEKPNPLKDPGEFRHQKHGWLGAGEVVKIHFLFPLLSHWVAWIDLVLLLQWQIRFRGFSCRTRPDPAGPIGDLNGDLKPLWGSTILIKPRFAQGDLMVYIFVFLVLGLLGKLCSSQVNYGELWNRKKSNFMGCHMDGFMAGFAVTSGLG